MSAELRLTEILLSGKVSYVEHNELHGFTLTANLHRITGYNRYFSIVEAQYSEINTDNMHAVWNGVMLELLERNDTIESFVVATYLAT